MLVAQPSEEVFGFRRSAVADRTIVRLFFGTEKVGREQLVHNENTDVFNKCG